MFFFFRTKKPGAADSKSIKVFGDYIQPINQHTRSIYHPWYYFLRTNTIAYFPHGMLLKVGCKHANSKVAS